MRRSLAHGRTIETLDIVLIDDHRGSQSVLRSMIGSFRVGRLRAYENAEDALKDMIIDPPCLVVTEWFMRPVSGHRLTRTLRSRSMAPLCFAPIIVISADVTMPMVEQAFSAGANAVMVKPVSPAALRRRFEWATRDDRKFVVDGDGYAVEGIDEVLEARVRRHGVGRSSKAAHSPKSTPIDAGIASDLAEGDALRPDSASNKASTWNSWVMN